jgi:hypothetical protein
MTTEPSNQEIFDTMMKLQNLELINKKFTIQKEIYNKYREYELTGRQWTNDDICNKATRDIEYTNYQKFLQKYILTHPERGILLYHKVGSGKTLSSILMAQALLQTQKYRGIVVLIPASIRAAFNNEIIKAGGDLQYYQFVHYNSNMITKNPLNLDNKIVIIDEYHNLVSTIVNRTTTGSFLYSKLLEATDAKIIALTGTPFINTTFELVPMINILRPDSFKFNEPDFYTKYFKITEDANGNSFQKLDNLTELYEKLKGLVSFYGGASEDSEVYPKKVIKSIKVPLKPKSSQGMAYLQLEQEEKEVYKKRKFSQNLGDLLVQDLEKTASSYMTSTRQASNVCPYKTKEEIYSNLKDNAIKLSVLLDYIKKAVGPVMVYSFFVENTLNVVEYILQKENITYSKWVGGLNQIERGEILKKFNNPANADGSISKVFLVSISGAEGISLKNVREVHILEPYWNDAKIYQLIGRSIRLCSHSGLPEVQRNVTVYKYLTFTKPSQIDKEHPVSYPNATTDIKIDMIAQRKYNVIKFLDTFVKESALDCILNYKENRYFIDSCAEAN